MTIKINKDYVSTKLGVANVNKAINLLETVFAGQKEVTGTDLNDMLSAMFDDYTSKTKANTLKKNVVLVPQKKLIEEQEQFLQNQSEILEKMKAEYQEASSKV